MERLQERIKIAEKALSKLEELITIEEPSSVERDAAIQRFEFTFEAVWKAAKNYLYEIEGIDFGSPKGVIRSCREIGIFNDEEAVLALQMTDDRNLTVHTYNEMLAMKIFEQIKNYFLLMKNWVCTMNKRLQKL